MSIQLRLCDSYINITNLKLTIYFGFRFTIYRVNPIGHNGSQLRNVGLFGALSGPPVTKVATKNETRGNHCLPHVFLGAVGLSVSLFLLNFSIRVQCFSLTMHCQT